MKGIHGKVDAPAAHMRWKKMKHHYGHLEECRGKEILTDKNCKIQTYQSIALTRKL